MARIPEADRPKLADNEGTYLPNSAPPLLDGVTYPSDLRLLEERDLAQLAAELRAELVDAV